MKYVFIILLLIAAVAADGQTVAPGIYKIAGRELKIPANCQIQSQAELSTDLEPILECEGFRLNWFPIKDTRETTLNFMLEEAVKESTNAEDSVAEKVQKKAVVIELLGTKAKAYQVSFKNTAVNKNHYSILAAARVNGQSLILQFISDKEISTNADFSDFAKQIIKFSK